LAALPDVQPLSVASGLPQIPEMSSWIGLVAPAGTPKDIVDKIQREVARIYADPAISSQLERSGINPVITTPAEFDKFFRDEAAHWTKVFKESGVKFD
jgi:tripartite-type tricarboxylate transporter receptor subunit TctC